MKRVVVTAGAAGIGLRIAQTYLAAGARVAICDVDAGALDSFRSANPDALAMIADVTDEAEMDAFFSACDEHLGGVDVMVSTAGIGGPAALIEDLEYADWQATLSTTLDGTFLSTRWGGETYACAEIWVDCVVVVNCGIVWVSLSQRLCHGKMGDRWIDENISHGNGWRWYSRELYLPRRG